MKTLHQSDTGLKVRRFCWNNLSKTLVTCFIYAERIFLVKQVCEISSSVFGKHLRKILSFVGKFVSWQQKWKVDFIMQIWKVDFIMHLRNCMHVHTFCRALLYTSKALDKHQTRPEDSSRHGNKEITILNRIETSQCSSDSTAAWWCRKIW